MYAQTNTDSLRAARQRIIDSTRAAQQAYNDSVRKERERVLDSTRTAQKQYFDSLRTARQHQLDSVKAVRQRISDSLAVIREYRQSKRYKDSVAAVRKARIDSIQTARQIKLDSIRAERKRVTDSIIAVRKAYTDSIRAVQKRRSDSLAQIREYRQSKRYKDSVEVVRKMKLDSIKAVRTAYYDSIKAERQRVNDSIAAVRKAYTDSITAVRKAYVDSVTAARKVRTDSLAKLKEQREKDKKVREKQREEKAKLALELKIKKKREAYNNEQMLKKRWRFPRSVFQNTFTRFNYYFNADQKMDEALDNMQRLRRDNYDSLLALFPFNPDTDSSVLAPDMDSIIQKASLGIQIHDPRTKWGDDLYLLLGQAYYYKGDYKNASAAFKYVVSLRDKRKKRNSSKKKSNNSIIQEEKTGLNKLLSHRSVHNEAILWLARTYTQQKKEGDAEAVLDLIEMDPNFTGSLSGRIALEKSYIRLSQKDYRGAVEPLNEVAKDKQLPDWVRMRAGYISGQISQQNEEYTASAASFKEVLELHPKVEMDFNAKKNMATSLMMAGGEQEDAIAVLKKILNDGKYNKYYEQVYYLLGKLSVNGGNEEEGITYLKKGIDAPKSTAAQKAKSYAALGDIYYDKRAYELAKSSYDSAAVYIGEGSVDAQMKTAIRRSVVLSNLTDPLNVIETNDSLLALAAMDEKEQKSVVRKYIKYLEDKRADSIFQAENAGLTAALKNSGNNNNNNSKNNYTNWYFSNPALMLKGYNEFKQKWGSRALADNWRVGATSGFAQNGGDEEQKEGYDSNGIPTEESLLAMIPNDEARKTEKTDEIKSAYITAANAYVKYLEDYPPALSLLDTFEKRFPDNEYTAEAIYIRYVVALKQDNVDDAKKYSGIILKDYPDSKWAAMVRPTEDGQGLEGSNAENVVVYYDKTYELLLNREFAAALPRAQNGQKIYDIPVYKDRFQIIEAIALASLEQFTPADSVISAFMTTHTDPNDSLRRWADAVSKYIRDNKPAEVLKQPDNTDTTNKLSVKVDGAPATGKPVAANFTYEPNTPHSVLFAFQNLEQRTKGVQAAIDDFDKFKFGSLNLSTELKMLNATQGVIRIQSFTNKNQAVIYMNTLKKTKQVFREYQNNEYQIIMISENNYNKLLNDKDIISYIKFYQSKY